MDFTRDVGASATRRIPAHGRCAESDLASLERYVVDATAIICLIRHNRTEIDGDCTLVAADPTVVKDATAASVSGANVQFGAVIPPTLAIVVGVV